jgi:hypothetical protein
VARRERDGVRAAMAQTKITGMWAMMVDRKNSRVDCGLDRQTEYIGCDRWTKWADGGGPNGAAKVVSILP